MKKLALVALVFGIAAGLSGCKQGRGDRCQINSDCSGGLVCSAATGTCTDQTSGGIDAVVPDAGKGIDAPKLDGGKMDAAKLDSGAIDAAGG